MQTTLGHLDECERCQNVLLSMKEAQRRYRVLLPPFVGGDEPRAYAAVAPGPHTFAVRATDTGANTGVAATHSWTVEQPLPDLVITALTETSFVVTNAGTAAAAGPFVVSVTLIGTFSFTGLAPNQSATRTWSACRRGTLTAIADRGRTVSESSEDNNTRSLASDC